MSLKWLQTGFKGGAETREFAGVARTFRGQSRKGPGGVAQIVRVVVAVDLLEGSPRHAEEAGRLPHRDALLHEPGRGRVPERVGRDALEPGPGAGRRKALFDIAEAGAVAVDDVAELRRAAPGMAQMRQKPRRDRHMRPALVGLLAPRRVEIDAPALEVDLSPAQRQQRLFLWPV